MAFSSNSDGGAMSDMNIIPLADVMLVLLVIFMMTAPIPSYPINIDLPQRSLNPPLNPLEPPEPIRLRIDQSGTIFWNDSPTPLSALRNMMETERSEEHTSELQSLMRISYAVFCLNKKNKQQYNLTN